MEPNSESTSMILKKMFQPFIKATLVSVGPTYVELSLYNVGRGAAIDINITFSVEPGEFKKTWYHPLLLPDDSESFFLPEEGDLKKLAEKHDIIIVQGIYKDIFSETHEVNEKIDLKQVQKGWHESGMILKETLENRIKELSDELEQIRRLIDRLIRDGLLMKTVEDVKREREEWKKFVEEKKEEMRRKTEIRKK